MSLDKYKIKIKKNSNRISESRPQYSLIYKSDPLDASKISHEIISAFVGKNDVIIELNSDMNGPVYGPVDPVTSFLDKTGPFDLTYRKKNVMSEKNSTLFGFHLRSPKKKQATEALAYIPNSVWRLEELKKCLPLYGARYFITDKTAEAQDILDELIGLEEEGRVKEYKMIIFDLAICGQMGLTSTFLSIDHIKGMLGV